MWRLLFCKSKNFLNVITVMTSSRLLKLGNSKGKIQIKKLCHCER
jgi:hypothetical protein